MITFLYYGVIFSVLLCFLALSGLVMWTFSFRNKEGRAHPRGNWKKGVVYAFGVGMLPWEKESARQHLPTYIAGILYHLGIFAGLLLLFCSLLEFVMSGLPLRLIQGIILIGLTAGVGLLLKRSVFGYMRHISGPDDFIANALVDLFLLSALLNSFLGGLQSFFWGAAIILFLYIPLGKIRHCFFFFYSRILFGVFFGRRGVYPKQKKITEV